MSEGGALIWCPFPDAAAAELAIMTLLDEGLIACGNIVPGVQSLFLWQGARDRADECGTLMKTAAFDLDRAMTRLETIHPYDTPAIMGWVVRTTEATERWLSGAASRCEE